MGGRGGRSGSVGRGRGRGRIGRPSTRFVVPLPPNVITGVRGGGRGGVRGE